MSDPHNTADADAHAYVRGHMAIREQISTFHLFLKLAKWGSLAVAALVLFLTVWFRPDGSFLPAILAAVVLAGLGFIALKPKAGAAH